VVAAACTCIFQPPAAAFAFAPLRRASRNVCRRKTDLRGGYDSTVGIDPSTPLQFFTTPGFTCPYAARSYIVLKELNIPFETQEVSGRPKPDWYLKINPRGKVPAIKIPTENNAVVFESAIICEYLCDTRPNSTLMPTDAVSRAQVRLLNDHCDTVLTPAQFTFFMNKNADKDRELSADLEEALMMYEEHLEKTGGPFLIGEYFTLADVHVLPFMLRLVVSLRQFKQYEVPAEKFPKLLKWYDMCSERDSVQAASLTDEKIHELYSMFLDIDYSFGGLNKNK
jgi:glutathione S-transferase